VLQPERGTEQIPNAHYHRSVRASATIKKLFFLRSSASLHNRQSALLTHPIFPLFSSLFPFSNSRVYHARKILYWMTMSKISFQHLGLEQWSRPVTCHQRQRFAWQPRHPSRVTLSLLHPCTPCTKLSHGTALGSGTVATGTCMLGCESRTWHRVRACSPQRPPPC
jgi:hypothetical protein